MLYFLIKKGNELHLLPVHTEEEVTFRLIYDQQILVEGISMLDVLRQFQVLSRLRWVRIVRIFSFNLIGAMGPLFCLPTTTSLIQLLNANAR